MVTATDYFNVRGEREKYEGVRHLKDGRLQSFLPRHRARISVECLFLLYTLNAFVFPLRVIRDGREIPPERVLR